MYTSTVVDGMLLHPSILLVKFRVPVASLSLLIRCMYARPSAIQDVEDLAPSPVIDHFAWLRLVKVALLGCGMQSAEIDREFEEHHAAAMYLTCDERNRRLRQAQARAAKDEEEERRVKREVDQRQRREIPNRRERRQCKKRLHQTMVCVEIPAIRPPPPPPPTTTTTTTNRPNARRRPARVAQSSGSNRPRPSRRIRRSAPRPAPSQTLITRPIVRAANANTQRAVRPRLLPQGQAVSTTARERSPVLDNARENANAVEGEDTSHTGDLTQLRDIVNLADVADTTDGEDADSGYMEEDGDDEKSVISISDSNPDSDSSSDDNGDEEEFASIGRGIKRPSEWKFSFSYNRS
ncbi:hypothetical protein FQN49_008089 [Arthroderma sp. PD_2]|nr:hypothetical protein FQN49_008089 [Arthroderma sp. PD_2]